VDASHRDPRWAIAARALLFPAVLVAAVAAVAGGLALGLPGMPLQFGTFLFALLAVIVFERILPADPAGNRARGGDWKVDAVSFAGIMAVVNPMLELGGPLLIAGLVAELGLIGSLGLFPSEWPFALQVALAALLAEFGGYWMHRLAHEAPFLWRFHASHHSSERIYWLNGYRVHPLNAIWNHLAGVFVVKLAGAGAEVVTVYLAIAGVLSAFQHANIRLILGPLNWIFSTNELHRWHHADRPEQANRNYGGVLIVWDLVFGTYYREPGARPARYGLFPGNERYPRASWWRQIAIPFAWSRGMR
jgi:sterol desaturase/sphingolipid hydroxylase (fatty acid hydroxylase superfamily)